MEGPNHEAKFVPFYARLERQVASPGAFRELTKLLNVMDVTRVLPHITAPTLVLQRREDQIVLVEQGRAVAERIPNARYIELQGGHHFPWLGEWEPIVGEIGKFLTGMRPAAASERVLSTVLFTDIVASTETAVAVGDRRWKELLAHHRSIARRLIADYRGVEQDAAGDGFMATFDGPARAIRCARAIVDETEALGLRVRAGIHTGECERVDGGVAGIAVHIAARVAADAEAGEVRVSSTVRDLVAGSGIAFSDLGGRALKGVPEQWHLYRVEV
jgi:class 3 adenylate cyclase